jgi:hypothetical protein
MTAPYLLFLWAQATVGAMVTEIDTWVQRPDAFSTGMWRSAVGGMGDWVRRRAREAFMSWLPLSTEDH